MKIEKFEDIFVWQEARVMVALVYKQFSPLKDYSFRDQIQRASVSVMNNIAEGFERSSDAEFKRFLYIAKASSGEVRSMLYLASDLKYISDSEFGTLLSKSQRLSASIMNFIKYLEK